MRAFVLAGLAVFAFANAAVADPACKFAWPVDRERDLLKTAMPIETGTVVPLPERLTRGDRPSYAYTLALKPAATIQLPHASPRPADPAKFSGYIGMQFPVEADYLVSLSSEGWIDAFQDDGEVQSTAHSGDPNCPGLRKSVRFHLKSGSLTLEIVNAPADRIGVAITPAP